jgi:hypothetical protein
MKSYRHLPALLTSILCALTLSAQAQVLLKTGDVFTYQFTSLPESVPSPGTVDRPVGGFALQLSSDEFNPVNDVLLVEMFENSTNEPPLATFVAEYFTDGTAISHAWADFQGVVRFTMLSGSTTLESITFFYMVPLDTETRDVRQMTVVPARGATLVDQLVPCEGPRSGGQWRNHGEYRSAVATVVQDLLAANAINQQEAQEIVATASHSSCGKK